MSAALDGFLDVAGEVRARVTNWLRGVTALSVHTDKDAQHLRMSWSPLQEGKECSNQVRSGLWTL